MVDEGGQFVLEVFDALKAGKGFVEAEESDDGGGLDDREPLIGLGVVADAEVALISGWKASAPGKAQGSSLPASGRKPGVWPGNPMLRKVISCSGKPLVQQCFEIVVVLHPLGEAIAEKTIVSRWRGSSGRSWRELFPPRRRLVVLRPLLVNLLLLGGRDGGEHLNAAAIA